MPKRKLFSALLAKDSKEIQQRDGLDGADVYQQRQHRLDGDNKEQNIKLRRITCYWTLAISGFWLVGVMILLWVSAATSTIQISDTVIITLLGTTTINIVGVPLVIIRSLFQEIKAKTK